MPSARQPALNAVVRWLQRRLRRETIRFTCWVFLIISLAILAAWFARWSQGKTLLNRPLGPDFCAIYLTGTLLNEYPEAPYDDLHLQYQLYHRILPDRPVGEGLPSVIAPYLTPLARFLAMLPYELAFLIWLLITVGLYIAGCRLLWSLRERIPDAEWSTFVLLAIAFEPFLIECWLNGQSSAIAFACVCLGLKLFNSHRPTGAGLVFSLLVYKPQFLVLLAPMLLIGRQWKVIFGGLIGGMGLAAVSLLAIGIGGCQEYLRMIFRFFDSTTGHFFELPAWKFVDVNQFFTFLFGGTTAVGLAIAAGISVVGLALLGRFWFRFPRYGPDQQLLLLAGTFALTPVLNAYMGIYESVLAIPAAFLLADSCYRREQAPVFPPSCQVLFALLFCVPWLAVGRVAQCTTIVLVLLAVYVMMQVNQTGEQKRDSNSEDGLDSERGIRLHDKTSDA